MNTENPNESYSFLTILKEYFAYASQGKSKATLIKHSFFHEGIKRFFTATEKENMTLREVRFRTIEEMRMWMHAQKKVTGEHVSRHIKHCKEAFEYAMLFEYIEYNPICKVKTVREKIKEPVSLTIHEIVKLQTSMFDRLSWILIKDLFLFQIYTGLSFMDLWLYEIETDYIFKEGKRIETLFISSRRGKNDKPYSVELNEWAADIHAKYEGKFPEITNKGYNRILKQVFKVLNFRRELCEDGSTHNGRKTYATFRYAQGMTLEAIADEMGNTPDVLKKHYITFNRERIKREIPNLHSNFLSLERKAG